MKKIFSILLSVLYLAFGICFVGCVGDKQATAQDFDLTIEFLGHSENVFGEE